MIRDALDTDLLKILPFKYRTVLKTEIRISYERFTEVGDLLADAKKPTACSARYSAGNPPFFYIRNPAVQISPDTEYHAVRISGASLTKSIGIQAPEKKLYIFN